MEVKQGDILVSQWGATMTLYDFYEVLGLTPSGKSLHLRRLEKESFNSDPGSLEVAPKKGCYEAGIITKKIKDGWVAITNYQFVNLKKTWDGREHYFENHMD
jgi:DNA-binding transcriptional ArsR family regulator